MKGGDRSRARRRLARVLLVLGCGVGICGGARGTESAFENVGSVAAADVLPAAFMQSAYFQIADDVRAEGNFYHFDVTTDFGRYQVSSLAMLRVRLEEIVMIAELSQRLGQKRLTIERSPEGRRGVASDQVADIISDPLGTASQLLGNLGYNLDRTLHERVPAAAPAIMPGRPADYMDPSPHKRSAAAQIGVDVYSSNRQLQDLLETLGGARGQGRVPVSATPLRAGRYLPAPFGSGVFDAELQSFLKNHSAAEVNAEVDQQLTTLGVRAETRIGLLTDPAYTPRTRLYLVSYLSLIEPLAGLPVIVESATAAATEGDAMAYVNYARMLAFYHLNTARLAAVVTEVGYPAVRTRDGRIVVALPVDYLAWTENTAAMLAFVDHLRSERDTAGAVVLLAGAPTGRARAVYARHDMPIRERYSF